MCVCVCVCVLDTGFMTATCVCWACVYFIGVCVLHDRKMCVLGLCVRYWCMYVCVCSTIVRCVCVGPWCTLLICVCVCVCVCVGSTTVICVCVCMSHARSRSE